MINSMFTAIGSLSLHQTYMDVVASNLANVNTPGYKSSVISFQDQFWQLVGAGAAPGAGLGGINPTQLGLGVRIGSINTTFTQGSLQSTGRPSDLAISGDGFFIYTDGTSLFYSRDGSLDLDANGNLVNTATGMRIQGWTSTEPGGDIDTQLPVGDIQIPADSTLAEATENVILAGNLSSGSAAGTWSSTIGVYDSLGALQDVTLDFTRTADNTWTWTATYDGATVGSGTLTFDTDGQYVSGGGTITIPGSGGAADTTVALDMTAITQLDTESTVEAASQDGLAAGSLTGFTVISDTGEILGLYSNGMQVRLGEVALATFVNPGGLLRAGQNLYQVGLNSGEARVGTAGTGGRGAMVSGYVEASNVDLAQEFTNMILAQRGFQASSRVITTSDEMLQELVNLKR